MTPFDSSARGPLDGVRVVDLSRLVCGNTLTLLLADFGADVVKIEDPKRGDPLRALLSQGISAHWKVYARNKRSLALDLRDAAGKAVLLDLIERSHVLVESFRPGTLERMELGPEVLFARNPRLAIVRISGFGQSGPYRDRPGFGTLVEAMSGFAAKNGFPDRPPLLPNMPLADMVAGLYGAFAVMVAIRSCEQGGRGQIIDLPLLEPLISVLGPDAAVYALTGRSPPRSGSRSDSVAPRNIYRAGDGGYIAISGSVPSMAERLFATIGRADMIDDPRFHDNEARMKNVDALDDAIQSWIGARGRDECLRILGEAEVTAGPVYDVGELIEDEHVQARGSFVSVPDAEARQILMHDIIPRLSETPGALRRAAPELGADSRAVLVELGYDASRIADLLAQGTVAAKM